MAQGHYVNGKDSVLEQVKLKGGAHDPNAITGHEVRLPAQ